MFEQKEDSSNTLDLDEATATFEMLEESGIGYRGTFTVDPTFNLKESDTEPPVPGFATPEGTAKYARRSSIVHPSNFKKVKIGHDSSEPLTLSKIIFGTDIAEESEAPQ